MSRGDFASLLFMKRLLSLSERGCFCLRENVPLRFREQMSFPQREIIVVEMAPVSERNCPPPFQREVLSVSGGGCLFLKRRSPPMFSERNRFCRTRKLFLPHEEIAFHFLRERLSLSQSLSQREAVSVGSRNCLACVREI